MQNLLRSQRGNYYWFSVQHLLGIVAQLHCNDLCEHWTERGEFILPISQCHLLSPSSSRFIIAANIKSRFNEFTPSLE